MVGTHTHVQTADDRILPKGTAYLTDVGMTGPHDSVIGVEVEAGTRPVSECDADAVRDGDRQSAIERRSSSRPTKTTGLAIDIERISYSLNEIEDMARGSGPDTRV